MINTKTMFNKLSEIKNFIFVNIILFLLVVVSMIDLSSNNGHLNEIMDSIEFSFLFISPPFLTITVFYIFGWVGKKLVSFVFLTLFVFLVFLLFDVWFRDQPEQEWLVFPILAFYFVGAVVLIKLIVTLITRCFDG